MGSILGARGFSNFPCPGNPQAPGSGAVQPGTAAALDSNSRPSSPLGVAGTIGNLTINGISRILDLTQWSYANVINWINSNVPGVVAAISPRHQLMLSSTTVPIVISGDAAILYCLGLTAGTTAL